MKFRKTYQLTEEDLKLIRDKIEELRKVQSYVNVLNITDTEVQAELFKFLLTILGNK